MKTCPFCSKNIPLEAIVCTECGVDLVRTPPTLEDLSKSVDSMMQMIGRLAVQLAVHRRLLLALDVPEEAFTFAERLMTGDKRVDERIGKIRKRRTEAEIRRIFAALDSKEQ